MTNKTIDFIVEAKQIRYLGKYTGKMNFEGKTIEYELIVLPREQIAGQAESCFELSIKNEHEKLDVTEYEPKSILLHIIMPAVGDIVRNPAVQDDLDGTFSRYEKRISGRDYFGQSSPFVEEHYASSYSGTVSGVGLSTLQGIIDKFGVTREGDRLAYHLRPRIVKYFP